MNTDCEYPAEELFEYLSASLDSSKSQAVAGHIKECAECLMFADIITGLRRQALVATHGDPNNDVGVTEASSLSTSGTTPDSSPSRGASPEDAGETHVSGKAAASPKTARPNTGSPRARKLPGVPWPLTLQDIDGSAKPEHPSLSEEMLPAEYQDQDSYRDDDRAERHPDTHQLACFFYESNREPNTAISETESTLQLHPSGAADIAAHVAMCRECAGYMFEFARAEGLARKGALKADLAADSQLESTDVSAAELIPAQAWKLIADWEESELAAPKPEAELLDCKTVEMLLRTFSQQRKEIYEMAQRDLIRCAEETSASEIVPAAVVDRQGAVHAVQLFKNVMFENGVQVLKTCGDANRFENKRLHALLDYGLPQVTVASDRINAGVARIAIDPPANSRLRQADYFILND